LPKTQLVLPICLARFKAEREALHAVKIREAAELTAIQAKAALIDVTAIVETFNTIRVEATRTAAEARRTADRKGCTATSKPSKLACKA
jgi:hypothetical protein